MTISRRKLIQVAGVGAAALALPKKARAAKKTLRIVQWNHFVPAYDKWFNNQYIKEWGQKNDTEVVVDNIGIPAINSTAAAEVAAKKGHDLFMFLWPKPVYEEDVIDHGEIYQECEKKYGKPISHWLDLIGSSELTRHKALVDVLKAAYGTGHGEATALVGYALVQRVADAGQSYP